MACIQMQVSAEDRLVSIIWLISFNNIALNNGTIPHNIVNNNY
jgi:hypothetical protein